MAEKLSVRPRRVARRVARMSGMTQEVDRREEPEWESDRSGHWSDQSEVENATFADGCNADTGAARHIYANLFTSLVRLLYVTETESTTFSF